MGITKLDSGKYEIHHTNGLIKVFRNGEEWRDETGDGVVGGALETSNVNVVTELINMIETQRAYEVNSKAISTADQMLQYASQNL